MSPPRIGPKCHDPAPEALMHILRRTTRAPLFCQPKYWSEVHLNALRVTGFGETYALKDVLGQRMICNPSDIHLIKATEEVSLLSYSGRFGKASEKMLKFHKSRPVDGKMEVCIQNMCIEWLKGVRDHVRRYPYIKIGIFQQLQDPLRVYYGGISTQVNAARVFDDYPDREHLPNGSFPILSINCTNHDVLAGTNDKNPLTEKLRAMRWAKRYKPAELICILLATAQQQARRIDPETFRVYQDERGLLYVQPIVLFITGTKVCFIRAKVPLRYIRALNSPCLVLEDTFDVKQSVPLDVLITSDRAELLIALAAVVDEYFQDVRLSLSEYKLTFKELVNFLVKEASRA